MPIFSTTLGWRLVLPLVFAGGVGAFVLVAGTTGFCPACQSVTTWLGWSAAPALAASADEAARPVAPAWTMSDLAGKAVSSRELAGKVVLLEFWTMSCPDCLAEMPTLTALEKQFGPQGLAIIGVSLDAGGVEEHQDFAQEHKLNYPVVFATKETEAAFGGIKGTPTAVLIDRQGRLAGRFVGYTEPAVLTAAITAALDQPAPAPSR